MSRSKLAVAYIAAIGAYCAPLLAQDAKLGDLGDLVKGASRATFAQDAARIAATVQEKTAGKLAQDSKFDPEAFARVLKFALDAAGDDPTGPTDPKGQANDEDDEETDEEKKKRLAAMDDEDDPKDDPKAAMDAAIASAVSNVKSEMRAIRQAEKDVAPFIGEIVAQDSAAAVYKLALDAAGVSTEGVHKSAFRAMVAMLPKPGTVVAPRAAVAQDAATASDFSKRFPTAAIPARG